MQLPSLRRTITVIITAVTIAVMMTMMALTAMMGSQKGRVKNL
jgi:hypothetical protein